MCVCMLRSISTAKCSCVMNILQFSIHFVIHLSIFVRVRETNEIKLIHFFLFFLIGSVLSLHLANHFFFLGGGGLVLFAD